MNTFATDSYTIIRGLVDPEWCRILYDYVRYSAMRSEIKQHNDKERYHEAWDGTFNDKQCPGSYSNYGDPMMDSMLMTHGPIFEQATGMKLAPSYSYYRMYKHGAELRRHKDRPSCEISATVCLDWDDSNCENVCTPWPIYVKTPQGEEVAVELRQGDAMVYKGCEVEHWREPFHGIAAAQLFYHYTDVNGERFNPWDGRAHGGIPHSFQRPKESSND